MNDPDVKFQRCDHCAPDGYHDYQECCPRFGIMTTPVDPDHNDYGHAEDYSQVDDYIHLADRLKECINNLEQHFPTRVNRVPVLCTITEADRLRRFLRHRGLYRPPGILHEPADITGRGACIMFVS